MTIMTPLGYRIHGRRLVEGKQAFYRTENQRVARSRQAEEALLIRVRKSAIC